MQPARQGAFATLFLVGAALSLFLMLRADSIAFAPQRHLYLITGIIMLVASCGPLHPVLDLPGQILTWNALGWCLGLVVCGWQGVGSLPLLPLILGGFAISWWPKRTHGMMPAGAMAIALLGGFAVVWLAWGDIRFTIPEQWREWL